MAEAADARAELDDLLAGQRLAVLCTQQEGQPYGSLVAFASEGRRAVFFATPRDTHKFRNLLSEPRAALLVDGRTHSPEDFQQAAAATAIGRVAELDGDARTQTEDRLGARHPALREFFRAPGTAVLRLDVREWRVVTRFQATARVLPDS